MSDRIRRLAGALALLSTVTPAAAADGVTLLDLPFRATALRGPGSEVAVATATSGLIPSMKPRPATAPGEEPAEETPVAVIWGEDGAAALGLVDGLVRSKAISPEAVRELVASETPRGALSGSRRAISGGLSAYLSGPTRALAPDGVTNAAALTVRERQAMAVTTEPKPVPVASATVPAGEGAVFAPFRPRALRLDGAPAFLATVLRGDGSALAVVSRKGSEAWNVTATGGAIKGDPLQVVAVAPFESGGRPAAATLSGGLLRLWRLSGVPFSPTQAPGFASEGAADPGDAAAPLDIDGDGVAELVLPVADRSAVALVSFADGTARERGRAALPSPAGFGLAVLGTGREARVLVGLADGRVALVPAALLAGGRAP
ncbi:MULTISPECIES: hypothetical protein [Methylobacterium]|uniref:FG-GAP repeat protein n=1 Tax=Methylobacterium jeotgali TaxID=381630 RepID=A0ABQ4SXW1_9HYPH|nr:MULTISPECIES: hypothetical protein [Methylobacterium]PIU04915.1 MAG: hypothetical protein COT56_17550 [Methylobacterium sp. CG09_land_8_20_14_0_10_71_15]PIU11282.1 MAG: hypothetical protein COT28_20865 [Methylobacterium sp. CG08_land_8_20_14_0_20_71_15]GBU20020.1 hypothetical protein AwMethylo_42350 [Methylobacterium sp.]GJE06753.1 hypothetical protein AOPFMNJM_2075 [Methylobacterium jeotgali]